MNDDDTKLFRRVDNDLDRKKLQKDLDQLSALSQHEQLRFHVDKCKIMRIGGSRNPHATYTMESVSLQNTDEEKDLGVWRYSSLKPLLEWIRQFLIGRKQRVDVAGCFSDWIMVLSAWSPTGISFWVRYFFYVTSTICRI